ncbi:hypothetical protein HN512_03965 [Candidatus Peregrinibacteria bacterium]|nr:hypothetical protein [Candidatus Peregrinibacteria bacterium]MBT3598965.1 hypothetical protein [Candidatus Peregrinibacteria bacterium]MBT4585509.1 hypothetical protein [Candidatus Peregrinibacteria bacterium]MBT6731324.1 hypothetical protein [Candidatus Peregrinibacteria bacterium]MBT7009711.1 hypothetical protein [Candidatus Peregrinibacteria bacterium]
MKVLFPNDGESWSAFVRRVQAEQGSVLLLLSGFDLFFARNKKERALFLDEIVKISSRIRIATKERKLVQDARKKGIRVIEKVTDLKNLLSDNESYDEAIRIFSPAVWQQRLRNNLQSMGLLSLPRLRVWLLILITGVLFFFVLFKLLPSAEIIVTPRQETITHTANIFLVSSGSLADIPSRVRTLKLNPIPVTVEKTITFDQISKEFIGESASIIFRVLNESNEQFSLRKGTRAMNQAGMIFRLAESISVRPREEVLVKAIADDKDLYGEIIGERGNVPAEIRWDFPGLPEEEQKLVYAINNNAAQGGVSDFRTILQENDLVAAKALLEQELLAEAKQLVDDHRLIYNSQHPNGYLEILYYDELTEIEYSNIVLPDEFLGEYVASAPISGIIKYTAYSYDSQAVLSMLQSELISHVEDGKRLLEETITMDRLIAHVIDYSDDLSWIKLTVDLSGTEEFVLDPLNPHGARFAKKGRELIIGKDKETAERILKNLPEVESVEINIWPPWNSGIPSIPSHISISLEK